MNALELYFEETGENLNRLAGRMGCASSTLTRPLKGERNASMDLALQVEEATGRKVSAEQFIAICLAAKRAAASEHEAA